MIRRPPRSNRTNTLFPYTTLFRSYTIVNGDATYDNTQPSTVAQFALTGLSDSANAVAYYDKGPIQARVAWNWRDEFLAGTGPNPFYVEEYWQIDASASYEFIPGLTGFVEAINLTGEGRSEEHTSELQSLMRISYAVFCLKKNTTKTKNY